MDREASPARNECEINSWQNEEHQQMLFIIMIMKGYG
jgi:hypothetical protein